MNLGFWFFWCTLEQTSRPGGVGRDGPPPTATLRYGSEVLEKILLSKLQGFLINSFVGGRLSTEMSEAGSASPSSTTTLTTPLGR